MAKLLIANKCKMCQKCKLCQKDQLCQSTNYARASIMQNCKKVCNVNNSKLLIMPKANNYDATVKIIKKCTYIVPRW